MEFNCTLPTSPLPWNVDPDIPLYYYAETCQTTQRNSSSNFASCSSCLSSSDWLSNRDRYLYVLYFAGFLLGFGTGLFLTSGFLYVEEAADRTHDVPIQFGFILFMSGLGEFVGSCFVRWFLSYPEDLNGSYVIEEWTVRAWWLGMVIFSCLLFVTVFPFLFFPKWINEPDWMTKKRLSRLNRLSRALAAAKEERHRRREKMKRDKQKKKLMASQTAAAAAAGNGDAALVAAGGGDVAVVASANALMMPPFKLEKENHLPARGEGSDNEDEEEVDDDDDENVSRRGVGEEQEEDRMQPNSVARRTMFETEELESFATTSDLYETRKTTNVNGSNVVVKPGRGVTFGAVRDLAVNDDDDDDDVISASRLQTNRQARNGSAKNSTSRQRLRSRRIQKRDKVAETLKKCFSLLWGVISSPTYSLAVFSTTISAYLPAGYRTNLSTFVHVHYAYDVSSSWFFSSGLCYALANSIGPLIGGLVIWKLRLSLINQVKMMITCLSINIIFFFLLFSVRCSDATIRWQNETNSASLFTLNPFAQTCFKGCDCSHVQLEPVCSAVGTRYFSPCHAGCAQVQLQQDSSSLIYTQCSCAPAVSSSYCKNSCPAYGAFWVLLFIAVVAHSMCYVSVLLIFLRVVDKEKRHVALSFAVWIVVLGAYIPGTAVFQGIENSSCLTSNAGCYSDESICWFYDFDKYRYVIHGSYIVFQAVAVLCFILVLWFMNRKARCQADPRNNEEQGNRRNGVTVVTSTDAIQLQPNDETNRNGSALMIVGCDDRLRPCYNNLALNPIDGEDEDLPSLPEYQYMNEKQLDGHSTPGYQLEDERTDRFRFPGYQREETKQVDNRLSFPEYQYADKEPLKSLGLPDYEQQYHADMAMAIAASLPEYQCRYEDNEMEVPHLYNPCKEQLDEVIDRPRLPAYQFQEMEFADEGKERKNSFPIEESGESMI